MKKRMVMLLTLVMIVTLLSVNVSASVQGECPKCETPITFDSYEPNCSDYVYAQGYCENGHLCTMPVDPVGCKPGTWETQTPATCGTAGLKVQKCTMCGTIMNSEEIEPTYEHEDVAWEETPAHCTNYTDVKGVCNDCGTTVWTVQGPIGCQAGKWEVVTEATCGTAGLKVQKCTMCGKVVNSEEIEPTYEHENVEWEETPAHCTNYTDVKGHCNDCGKTVYTVQGPIGCQAGTWEVVTEATCGAAGLKVQKCTICGEVVNSEPIAPTYDHKNVDWEDIPAHCTNYVDWKGVCQDCGLPVTSVKEPIGCQAGDWEVVTEATCMNDGLKVQKCTICHEIVNSEAIVADGHNFKTCAKRNATCEKAGYKVSFCVDCFHYETETIPATGHSYKLVKTKNATCKKDGYKLYECENGHCHDKYKETIPALEHNFYKGKCTECGTRDKNHKPGKPGMHWWYGF